MIENLTESPETTQSVGNSTLLEFPGVNRNRPAWRKELSERFREIQQRRAREAALEAEAEAAQAQAAPPAADDFDAVVVPASKPPESGKQLGLVPPPPDAPEMNPIVVAALARLERARSQAAHTHVSRGGSRHAAAAVARVVQEELEPLPLPVLEPEPAPPPPAESLRAPAPSKRRAPVEKTAEAAEASEVAPRASSLVVVQPKPHAPKAEPPAAAAEVAAAKTEVAEAVVAEAQAVASVAASAPATTEEKKEVHSNAEGTAAVVESNEAKPQPRHISGVIDDHWLERHGTEVLPQVAAAQVSADDRAPRFGRFVAALADLLVVAFLSAPFAAVIELTIGNWGDPRVLGSMGGIVVLVMFLYHTCSVALAGRTCGMSLLSLHAVDARTASVPRTGQCARRAFFYILSLATLGLGLLYSLFDAEGRAAHDLLSGTVVVKE